MEKGAKLETGKQREGKGERGREGNLTVDAYFGGIGIFPQYNVHTAAHHVLRVIIKCFTGKSHFFKWPSG